MAQINMENFAETNSNRRKPSTKDEQEHQLISDLLFGLAKAVKNDSCAYSTSLSHSSAIRTAVTPPNTPSADHKNFILPGQAADWRAAASAAGDSIMASTSIIRSANIANGTAGKADNKSSRDPAVSNAVDSDTVLQVNTDNPDSGKDLADALVVTDAVNLTGINDASLSADTARYQNRYDVNGNKEVPSIENEDVIGEVSEHKLIKSCVTRLQREASTKRSDLNTANSPTQTSCTVAPWTSSDEEHSLIVNYASTLPRTTKLTASSLSAERAPVLSAAPSVSGAAERSDRRREVNEEHLLINSYTSSLAEHTSVTTRTSRRSSAEMDIESVQQFYETQKQVFLQLQKSNLELRKKIAEMKASGSSLATGSMRSESPLPPAHPGQWSVSEYYRYEANDELPSPGSENALALGHQTSRDRSFMRPGIDNDGTRGDCSPPVFYSDMMKNEKMDDKNERLQQLQEKRQELTQKLNQLLTEENGSTSFNYDNGALRVN